MKTELTFDVDELIAALEADIAEAHYRRIAAERIAARQQRGLQELRELIDGDDDDMFYAVASIVLAAATIVLFFWL